MITKALDLLKNKYKDHSDAFSAYLFINNYDGTYSMTEDYVKI